MDTRTIVGRDGRLITEPPPGLNDDAGRAAYATLAGATVHAARERIVRLLRNSGNLEAAGHISHIEVVTTRDGELFAEVSL